MTCNIHERILVDYPLNSPALEKDIFFTTKTDSFAQFMGIQDLLGKPGFYLVH